MATSGTVGQTVINVQTLIEHAMRRSGVPTSDITPEVNQAALNNLYFLLVSLSNQGVNLWTVDRYPLGTVSGVKVYDLPVGTIGALSAAYRTVTLPSGGTASSSAGGVAENAFDQDIETACTQTSANGNISYDFGSDSGPRIVSAGIMANGTRYLSLVFEYSQDGATWTAIHTAPRNALYPDRQWVYYDIPNGQNAQYFRVRETNNGILDVREIVFGSSTNEIVLGRLSQDMYDGLADKDQRGRPPVSYLFNRLRTQPQVWFWPVPQYNFDQVIFRLYRNIQDVGAVTNEVEIPERWQEAIVNELAMRMIVEIPGADLSRIQVLNGMTTIASTLASAEERDDSPKQILPALSCYTV